MSLRFLDLLSFAMLVLAAHAMPLYTDESNKTLALVLCGNLHDAVLALKQRQIIDHVIGADWLESNTSVEGAPHSPAYCRHAGHCSRTAEASCSVAAWGCMRVRAHLVASAPTSTLACGLN
jgi:hypothetical protein